MGQLLKRCILTAALLVVLLPATLWSKDIPTVRVAAFNYYPAIFLDTDNVVRGFYVDMLDDIAAREQIRFEYVFGSWNEGLERLQAGEVDLVTSAAYTAERAAFMDFGEQALLTVWGELYVPRDAPIVSLKELQDQPIAVMRSGYNARSFKDHLDQFGISSQFIEFADFDEVLEAVKTKQVVGGVVNSVFGDAAAQQYGAQPSGIAFNPFDIYFATAKGHHADLLTLLDEYLSDWRNDSASVYYQARLQWGAGQPPEEVIPAWILKSALAAALLLVLGLVFIVLLRHRVHTATRELQESNNMISLLLDSTAEAIYGLDPDGICTFCNAACVRMLGYDNANQLIGHNINDLIHHPHADGPDFPAQECSHLKVYEEQIHCDREVFRRADGSDFPVEYWSYPIRQDGNDIGLVVSFVDITERKEAQEQLRTNEERLRVALNGAPMVLFNQDRDLRYTWIHNPNPVYKIEQIIGRTDADLLPGQEAASLMTLKQQVLESGRGIRQNVITTIKNKTFVYDLTIEALRDETGAIVGITCASLDITELKRAEETLQQKNEELEQFVYSVSHDLKSPLVTVKSFVGMLRQDLLSADQPQIDKDLNYIDKAADKMQQLLDALLHYSRIGRKDAPPQTLSAGQQVEDCLSALAGILRHKQVQVAIGDMPCQLHGDPLHFERIWQNLIENAVKYMGDQAQPQIEIGSMQQGHDVIFYVRDNGMGIAPKHSERIFNLFSQLDPKSEGSGLGLALVKKIVTSYRGRIWVESAGTNQGSFFYFTLPGALIKKTA